MNNLNIEQNNEVLKNTSDSIIEFLYNLSKGLDSNVPQYMKGRLEIPHGYADAIDFLTSKFQDLYINSSQGAYIRFKDNTIQSKLANAYGDGIGLTIQQAASITAPNAMGNLFRGNTVITSFDELSYFINLREIGPDGFRGCTNLTSVDLRNVDTLNRYAFASCDKLSTIKNYQHVTTYGYSVFDNCDLLGDYDFSGVNVSNNTSDNRILGFYNNKHITSIIMPQVQYLCSFHNCQSLTSLTGLESVINIPSDCFSNCYLLQNLNMPNLEVMGQRVFEYCNAMTIIDLPKLKQCKYSAFNNNTNLVEVNVPLLDTIETGTFSGNPKLETVTIGPITKIPNNTFYNCKKLSTLNMDFSLITDINYQAFYCCESLTSLSFPNVTKINDQNNFSGCTGLTSISIPKLTTITGNYQGGTFSNCTSLESVDFPLLTLNTNTGYFLNGCTSLISASLPSTTIIPDKLFYGCNHLETINIDWSAITYIGSYAFYNCSAFTNNDEPLVFSSLESLTSPQPFLNFGVTHLKFPALLSFTSELGYSNLTSIEFNLNITSLPNSAICNSKKLETVSKLGNVISVGSQCFIWDNALTSLDFSNKLKTINNEAFKGVSAIEYISTETIYPTYIGEDAFNNCSSLKGRIDLSQCTTLKGGAFNSCSSLTSIGTLNSELTSIGAWAFFNTGITGNLDIPESVTSIGDGCFRRMRSLTSLTFNSLTPPTRNGDTQFEESSYIIYVPASAVQTYIDAWGMNNRIQAKP